MIPLDKALEHTEYGQLPEHLLRPLYDYVEWHKVCGHFLTDVLANDLFGAVSRADSESLKSLHLLITFIHMNVPTHCYGSREKVRSWLNLRN